MSDYLEVLLRLGSREIGIPSPCLACEYDDMGICRYPKKCHIWEYGNEGWAPVLMWEDLTQHIGCFARYW